MAGDWIKLEHATVDKPEVLQMAEILNTSADDVLGKLVRVWIWFDLQSRDGNAGSVTGNALKRFIDRLVASQGFASCMEKVGWLNDKGIPNFDRHNGESSKKRALTNKRQKRFRNADTNAPITLDALPEKRREEITTNTPALPEQRRKTKATPLPTDFRVSPRVRKWGLERGYSEDTLKRHCEFFALQAAAKGYVYSDWDAALMKAITADWAGLKAVLPAAQSLTKAQAQIAEQRAVAAAPMPDALRRFVR